MCTMNFSTPGAPAIAAAIPGGSSSRGGGGEISCLSYHEDGGRLFAASAADQTLQVIDCRDGKADGPPLRCERERIQLVESTCVRTMRVRQRIVSTVACCIIQCAVSTRALVT